MLKYYGEKQPDFLNKRDEDQKNLVFEFQYSGDTRKLELQSRSCLKDGFIKNVEKS